MNVDDIDEDALAFACTHSEDNQARIKAVTDWALEFTGAKDRADLMTAIVHKLNWDYGASVDGIPTDMWSAIVVKTYDEDEAFETYTQCDDIIDGMVFTLRRFFLKYGKTREEEVQIGPE